MADEWIKVGATFTVTLDTTPLTTLDSYSGQRVYYRRPDGTKGYLSPDSVGASSMVATVTPTLNPASVSTGDPRWANGYPGVWQFYAYCVGSGTVTLRSKEAKLEVHPEWSTP